MNREKSDAKRWRSIAANHSGKKSSWATRRQGSASVSLPVEAIDAAFESESEEITSDASTMQHATAVSQVQENAQNSSDVIQNLSKQLSMLEAQHDQISRLLAELGSQTQ